MKGFIMLTKSRMLAAALLAAVGCGSSETPEHVAMTQQALTCGLVAAYSFDQTSGSVLNDISGNGNHGTVTTPTWVTNSKFGRALSFNGSSAGVTIPSSPSLNAMTQMTLESWVRPQSLGGKWRTVLVKESAPADLTFGLYANQNIHESSPRPGFWLRTGTSPAVPTTGPTSLVGSTWSHLAASYDGSVVRFYVNGTEVASREQTGSIATSSGNLRIGQSAMWPDTEAFAGQIDVTCIWGTVRTASEIQADMLLPDCGVSTCGSGGSGGAGGSAGAAGTGGSGAGAGAGGAAGSGGSGGSSAGAAGMAGTAGTSGGAGGTGGGASVSYSTNFDLTESPLFENGAWNHFGLDWNYVRTGSGLAFGSQMSFGSFDDSYAYLSGFPPDQQASGIIHLDPNNVHANHEVEILLRWSDSAHDAHGYECNLASDGSYAEIVRWNGPIGNYTMLQHVPGVPGGVHDGDEMSAKVVGNVISYYLNGNLLTSAIDSTWTTGNPGAGFYRSTPVGSFDGDFSFTSFSAASIP